MGETPTGSRILLQRDWERKDLCFMDAAFPEAIKESGTFACTLLSESEALFWVGSEDPLVRAACMKPGQRARAPGEKGPGVRRGD